MSTFIRFYSDILSDSDITAFILIPDHKFFLAMIYLESYFLGQLAYGHIASRKPRTITEVKQSQYLVGLPFVNKTYCKFGCVVGVIIMLGIIKL